MRAGKAAVPAWQRCSILRTGCGRDCGDDRSAFDSVGFRRYEAGEKKDDPRGFKHLKRRKVGEKDNVQARNRTASA